MKFGNWNVAEGRIEFTGSKKFVIDKAGLGELIKSEDSDDDLYKCIVSITEDDSFSDDDLYDFNFAFVYAMALGGVEFDYETFDLSLDYQYEILSDEDVHPGTASNTTDESDLEQQRKEALTERD